MIIIKGLIAYLIPYIYFRFRVGSLCFKSLKLVPYVLKVSIWSKTLLTLEYVSPFRDMILSLIILKML